MAWQCEVPTAGCKTLCWIVGSFRIAEIDGERLIPLHALSFPHLEVQMRVLLRRSRGADFADDLADGDLVAHVDEHAAVAQVEVRRHGPVVVEDVHAVLMPAGRILIAEGPEAAIQMRNNSTQR